MRQRLLLFLCACFLPLALLAQSRLFKRLEASSDIRQVEIFCLYTDSNGMMWMGTTNGLYSYDGHTFKHYKNPIEGDFAIAAIQEVNHQLWIGAWRGSGLWIFDKDTGRFTHAKQIPKLASFLSDSYCVRQFFLHGDTLWFASTLNQKKGSMLVRYVIKTGEFQHYLFPPSPDTPPLAFNTLTRTQENGTETIWMGSSNGLYEFNPEARTYTIHRADPTDSQALNSNEIWHVYSSPSQPILWICTSSGLHKLNLKTRKIIQKYIHTSKNDEGLGSNRVWRVVEVGSLLWIATDDGLNTLNMETEQIARYVYHPKEQQTISGNHLRYLHVHQNMLWIATFGNGISLTDLGAPMFNYYPFGTTPKEPLAGTTIFRLLPANVDNRKGVWIGTDEGLYFFDPLQEKFSLYGIDHTFTHFVAQDHHLWVGGEKGFGCFDIRKKAFIPNPFHGNLLDKINAFQPEWFSTFTNDSLTIWAGSWEHGITSIQTENLNIRNYQPNVVNPTSSGNGKQAYCPTPVLFQGKKYIFFASVVPVPSAIVPTIRNCLIRLDVEKNKFIYYLPHPDSPYQPKASYFISMHNSGDSVLWIGSRNGGVEKFTLATGKFTHYQAEQGIVASTIYDLETDLHGNLWMSTNEGISKLDIRTGKVSHYNGKSPEGHHWMAMTRDAEGRIYYGTRQGLVVFHPDSMRVNYYPPPTVITSFKVFEQSYDSLIYSRTPVLLPYDQNFVTFEFAGLNYRDSERNMYQYQLMGIDKNWVYAGNQHFASYTDLSPGNYEFRVKSSNNDGVWNTRWVSFTFVIQPPWWASWWFRIVAFLTTALLLFLMYRLRVNSLKTRQLTLERQVRSRTAEIIHQKEEIAVQQEQLTRINDYLKLLSDTLEERVHARTDELVKANDALRRKNQEIQRALVQGQTEERKRVAAELHDNLGGLLSALRLSLETLNADQLLPAEKKLYENVLKMVVSACAEVRNISHHMLPEILEKEGIEKALERLVQSINATGKLTFETDFFGLEKRINKEVEYNLYPVCVELVNNIVKHSHATEATLQIVYTVDEISVVIQDNGRGLQHTPTAAGMGLQNMRSRIAAMHGKYHIDSKPERGTTISIEIPLTIQPDTSASN